VVGEIVNAHARYQSLHFTVELLVVSATDFAVTWMCPRRFQRCKVPVAVMSRQWLSKLLGC